MTPTSGRGSGWSYCKVTRVRVVRESLRLVGRERPLDPSLREEKHGKKDEEIHPSNITLRWHRLWKALRRFCDKSTMQINPQLWPTRSRGESKVNLFLFWAAVCANIVLPSGLAYEARRSSPTSQHDCCTGPPKPRALAGWARANDVGGVTHSRVCPCALRIPQVTLSPPIHHREPLNVTAIILEARSSRYTHAASTWTQVKAAHVPKAAISQFVHGLSMSQDRVLRKMNNDTSPMD